MEHKLTACWWGRQLAWEFRVAQYLNGVHSDGVAVSVNGLACLRVSGFSVFIGPLEIRWWKTSGGEGVKSG